MNDFLQNYAEATETLRQGLAKHDVPGFRLARIATDVRFQRQGLGGRLLVMSLATFAEELKAKGLI
jgi:ribosomal protein S18 acetylase RimI-like enzyme